VAFVSLVDAFAVLFGGFRFTVVRENCFGAGSIHGLLNRFEYPTRASIYVALLEYAFVVNYFGRRTKKERSVQLNNISAHVVAPAVSAQEIEKVLNNAATTFSYLLEGAKGVFAVYFHGCLKRCFAWTNSKSM
jgi:hypothetical protein